MGYVWIWKETHNWQGPDSLIDGKIVPSKPGAFTITFNKDGTVSGTTDCNSFSGTYILDEKILGRVTFGPFALTKMFCEGSQEIEYIAMLRESHFSIGENNLYLETDNIKTVIFDKRE
jgi:heat shock protein HslJ